MEPDKIEESLGNVLEENGIREDKFGYYHPSEVSGCPLSTFLDYMTESETILNKWLFQGSAVHYYLQETGLLDKALHKAGYHTLDTKYEVPTNYDLGDGAKITGTCDILTHDGDDTIILDIKYSSVKPSTGTGRVYKYLSQVNTYAHMFGADEYGLLLINNRADNIPEEINVVEGTPSEDNWELVKLKARAVHRALNRYGYPDGERWSTKQLKNAGVDTWKDIMEDIPEEHSPSYDGECRYCDHKDYCPVENGKLGGLRSLKGGK